jgi:hypothetical protein
MTEIPNVTRTMRISFLDFVHWVIGIQLIAYEGLVSNHGERKFDVKKQFTDYSCLFSLRR